MTMADTPSSDDLAVDQALQQAITLHRTGNLPKAEAGYLAILKTLPQHPVANHNLGVITVQRQQPLLALPYFKKALETNPKQQQYFLSYIDALIRSNQVDAARQALVQMRKRGFKGEAVEAMATRLKTLTTVTSRISPHSIKQNGKKSGQYNQKSRRTTETDAKPSPDSVFASTQPITAPTSEEIKELVALFNQGHYYEAEALALKIIKDFPHFGFGWKALGTVFKLQGRALESLPHLQKATILLPLDAEAQFNLGGTLKDLGRLQEAETSFRQALTIKPNYSEAFNNLGITLNDLGRREEAEACYLQALAINPDLAEAHSNLGITLKNLGRLQESEASYRRALEIKPNYAEVHNNLGKLFQNMDQQEDAKASYLRAIEINPDYTEAYNNLGTTLQCIGRLKEAESSYRRALLIKHDFPEAHNNLGVVLHNLGRRMEAGIHYRKALELKSDYAEAYNNLGITLNDLGRMAEAEACYRRALKIKPDFAEAHCNLGANLKDLGRLEEAENCCRQALKIQPDYVRARSSLLFNLSYSARHSSVYHLEEARRYGQMVAKMVRSRFSVWRCLPRPIRLRVGVVSGDLNIHPVGFFLESVLAQIDPARVELIAYATDSMEDELTSRVKPFFSAWKSLVGQSDEAAAKLIHGDGIHLLLDLSGHTGKNRLPVFAWKPAPVQASWLGFLATTGVEEIDYVLGDPVATPAEDDRNFSEKVWRLPEIYCCFTPPDVEVDVGPLPALTTGRITFGCFNHLSKMTDAVVALWARVLKAVPDSRLFLKTRQLNDLSVRETTVKRFAAQGIASGQLWLEGGSPRAELLAAYQQIDIALDPFPYNGGTTTMESLWMAVPVLTLSGDRFLSRCTQSCVFNAGLSDWIAADGDDYVARAVTHAADLDRLAALRRCLRQQVLVSPLFDAPRFARHFEAALWGMWEKQDMQP